MKRIVAVLLVCAMCLGLCACGAPSASDDGDSVEQQIKDKVRDTLCTALFVEYQRAPSNLTAFVKKNSDGSYTVTGKISLRDEYGDSYTGKYKADAEWDAEKEEADVTDWSIDTMYKD